MTVLQIVEVDLAFTLRDDARDGRNVGQLLHDASREQLAEQLRLLMGQLARDRDQRFQSVREMVDAFLPIAGGAPLGMTSSGGHQSPFAPGSGPARAGLTVALYMYEQGFGQYEMGYGAAVAYLLFAIVLVFTMVQFRVLSEGRTPKETGK